MCLGVVGDMQDMDASQHPTHTAGVEVYSGV